MAIAHDPFNEVHLAEVLSIVYAVLLKILQMEVITFTVRYQLLRIFCHKNDMLFLHYQTLLHFLCIALVSLIIKIITHLMLELIINIAIYVSI